MECPGSRGLFKYEVVIKRFILLLALLFGAGCDETEIYSQFLTKEPVQVPRCIRPDSVGPFSGIVKEAFEKEGFIIEAACDYHVALYQGLSSCSAEGKGSSGFLRLELFLGQKALYRVQKEFFAGEEAVVIHRLVDRLRRDIRAKAK